MKNKAQEFDKKFDKGEDVSKYLDVSKAKRRPKPPASLTNNPGKYTTEGLAEAEFEPGSRGRVLKNLLGIKSKREMDRHEAQELFRALSESAAKYDRAHSFTGDDICSMHKAWLGGIYEWAGKYRLVNLSKGNFTFAAAKYIPGLMGKFEKGPLTKFTPCSFNSQDEIVNALAEVHAELVLIHPFRDGNGRVARMLATLMALQAGLPPLDFGMLRSKKREYYFRAIGAALEREYGPMRKVFSDVISRTLSKSRP